MAPKQRLRFAATALAALLATACLEPLSTEAPPPPGVARTLTVDGLQRRFRLVAPAGSAPSAGRPLLLVYHGSGGSAEEHISYTDFPTVAINAGMLVAYMDAANGTEGRWITQPDDLDVADDVNYTRAVIEALDNEFNVDNNRVFAVGFSRGGDFVAQLACRDPQLVRAIAPVASTTLKVIVDWCNTTDESLVQPAVTITLGSQDPLMPWDESSPRRMSATESAEFWASRNGCGPDAEVATLPSRPGYSVDRWTYPSCTKAPVLLYRIDPLQHFWPSAGFNFEQVVVQWMLSLPPRAAVGI